MSFSIQSELETFRNTNTSYNEGVQRRGCESQQGQWETQKEGNILTVKSKY